MIPIPGHQCSGGGSLRWLAVWSLGCPFLIVASAAVGKFFPPHLLLEISYLHILCGGSSFCECRGEGICSLLAVGCVLCAVCSSVPACRFICGVLGVIRTSNSTRDVSNTCALNWLWHASCASCDLRRCGRDCEAQLIHRVLVQRR